MQEPKKQEMVRKREVYAPAFNMPYWISKIGKVNQKTKENLIYSLYIFLLFPVSPNNSVACACTGIISKLRHLVFSFFALMH